MTSATDSTSVHATQLVGVTVLLFSVLREEVGRRELRVELRPGATVADLLSQLSDAYPAIRAHRASLRVGVNAEYAHDEYRLGAGDEVALITPVSGG